MALVVLLRGINVGGHRALRPKLLARELRAFDVVNVGAAGTFVVRRPGSLPHFRHELRARLPDTVRFVCCEGRDLLRLAATIPIGEPPSAPDRIRFVSFLATRGRAQPTLPLTIPSSGDWFVRVTALTGRFAVGEHRRHMKTIGYLGRLDKLFGTLVTTRSWSTIEAVLRILDAGRPT